LYKSNTIRRALIRGGPQVEILQRIGTSASRDSYFGSLDVVVELIHEHTGEHSIPGGTLGEKPDLVNLLG
jgi:hypothetical protein